MEDTSTAVFLPSARRALDLGILQLLGENPTGNIHRGFIRRKFYRQEYF